MSTIFAINSNGILSLDHDSIIEYVKTQYYPSSSPEQVNALLKLFPTTMKAFPLRRPVGTPLVNSQGEIEKLETEQYLDKAIYYLVNPLIVRDLVAEE